MVLGRSAGVAFSGRQPDVHTTTNKQNNIKKSQFHIAKPTGVVSAVRAAMARCFEYR